MTRQSGLAILDSQVEWRDQSEEPTEPGIKPPIDANSLLPMAAIALESNDDRSQLIQLLISMNIAVVAHKCLETLQRSFFRDRLDLLVTDVTLPDGNWIDVLRLTMKASPSPGIIVHSRVINDRLWSEVLWRGAYDMLIAPYAADDARRVIEGALRTGCLRAGREQTDPNGR